jgi:DNA repair exonuclease SbcCD ATPase subunit
MTHYNKIIHVADIHIRLYKRHQEYREVFKKLYDSLARRSDIAESVIVVAGDIVHSKTDMSPEMVEMVSNFLKELRALTRVIVIPGNHDMNLANRNRLDALTPIIDNINADDDKKIDYLKHSTIFKLENLSFSVCSLLDDSWPVVPSNSTDTKIALYHGPINNATTDIGYKITNRIGVSSFDGYDMVLLGDIHQTQVLQEKAPGLPEIWYPGSLIQQNHGESFESHGYLVWDVDTCKVVEFVEIKNDYAYFTLRISGDTIPPLPTNLPQNLRLRLVVENIDNHKIKKLIAVLRKKFTILEFSINQSKQSNVDVKNATNDIEHINDVNVQNKLIGKFIDEHDTASESLRDKVLEISTSLNDQIHDDELPKNIRWKPISLKFDNLFSYGAGNSINFEDMTGVYGVFSANATGKTSAFDAMCFALYDKTPRAFKGSHIMNTRSDTFSCEFEFDVEGVRYIIERNGTRKKNNEVKVDVNFFRVENDERISLNGDDRRDTNANIRSYVGSYEDFILTSLSVQNQNSLFIDIGQSDRKDLLSQFTGLTIFDRLFNMASDEIKELSGAIKNFKNDDFTKNLAEIQSSLDSLSIRDLQNKEREVALTTDISTLENEIQLNKASLRTHLSPILSTNSKDTPDEIKRHIAESVKELDASMLLYSSKKDTIRKQQEQIKTLSTTLETYQTDGFVTTYKEYQSILEKGKQLDSELSLMQLEINHNVAKLDKLKKHEYDPNCKFCVNNIFVKDALATKELLKSQESKMYDKRVEYDELARQLKDARFIDIDMKYTEYFKLRESIPQLEGQLYQTEFETVKMWESITLFNKRLDESVRRLEAMNQYAQDIEHNIEVNTRIDKFTQQLNDAKSELAQVNQISMQLYADQQVLRSKKDAIIEKLNTFQSLEETYKAYELYLHIVGRDGLPYQLIQTIIPMLESEINQILSQVVEFHVRLEVDGKNINGHIVYAESRTWPLELASGMEKFITGLAIRVALMSISNLPRSNFLVIDEGFGVLDADNLSSMFPLFNMLKNEFDFMILISHLDIVRDIADSLIEIKREDGYSYITIQ